MFWCENAHTAIQVLVSSSGNVPCIQCVIPPRLEQSAVFIIYKKKKNKDKDNPISFNMIIDT